MLNEVLSQLEQLTEKFILRLSETTYEEVEIFVEVRQMKVDQLLNVLENTSMTAEQKQKLEYILSYDALINQHMQSLKLEAQKWLVQRKVAKSQRSAYETNYTPDSILMDRRK
jgi:glycyl-tRNA synthetase (class II)